MCNNPQDQLSHTVSFHHTTPQYTQLTQTRRGHSGEHLAVQVKNATTLPQESIPIILVIHVGGRSE